MNLKCHTPDSYYFMLLYRHDFSQAAPTTENRSFNVKLMYYVGSTSQLPRNFWLFKERIIFYSIFWRKQSFVNICQQIIEEMNMFLVAKSQSIFSSKNSVNKTQLDVECR